MSIYRLLNWKPFALLLIAGLGTAEVQGYQLPDTGQTECYDNNGNVLDCGGTFYGEDAQWIGAQPAYQDNGDGTVTDLNTGLMWQQDGGNFGTWQDARNICIAQTLGGYNDWRVPGRRELVSIVNYGRLDPAINTDLFPATASLSYWSNTEIVALRLNPYYVWVVNFASGVVIPTERNVKHYVRCVRGNQLPEGAGYGQFTDNGNCTVTDNATGLVWEKQGISCGRIIPRGTWADALFDCENLVVAGYDDWRLPNVRELESLVDLVGNSRPAIDPVFNCCGNPPWYWSSTTSERYPGTAWVVVFTWLFQGEESTEGIVGLSPGPYFKNGPDGSIRCVR
jgi:hypothetical protein